VPPIDTATTSSSPTVAARLLLGSVVDHLQVGRVRTQPHPEIAVVRVNKRRRRDGNDKIDREYNPWDMCEEVQLKPAAENKWYIEEREDENLHVINAISL